MNFDTGPPFLDSFNVFGEFIIVAAGVISLCSSLTILDIGATSYTTSLTLNPKEVKMFVLDDGDDNRSRS